MMSAEIGDGVYYHGSKETRHGLYGVAGVSPHPSGARYRLASYSSEESLLNVREESFEVLAPRAVTRYWTTSKEGG